MGWPIIWKNALRVESASSSRSKQSTRAAFARRPFYRNGNAAFRADSESFDLVAHFLHAIVVSVDFMMFHTRNMRDAAEEASGAALSGAVGTFDSIRLYRYRQVSFLLRGLSCNYFGIITLGV